MIYSETYYPRRIEERAMLVHPECWAVYMRAESVGDDLEIQDMRNWAESHEYGRFIMFLDKAGHNYTVEFDREQEYLEFKLRWM